MRKWPVFGPIAGTFHSIGPGPLLHPGLLAGLGDDGFAVVEVPGAHSSLDVEGVEAVLVQPGDGSVRASAGAADDVHVVVERQVVEAGGQFAQRHVVRAFDVPGFPLVVFTDVDDGGTFGHVIDIEGDWFTLVGCGVVVDGETIGYGMGGAGLLSIHGASVGTQRRWPRPPGTGPGVPFQGGCCRSEGHVRMTVQPFMRSPITARISDCRVRRTVTARIATGAPGTVCEGKWSWSTEIRVTRSLPRRRHATSQPSWTRRPRRLPGPRTWNLTPGSDTSSRTLRIAPRPPPKRRG